MTAFIQLDNLINIFNQIVKLNLKGGVKQTKEFLGKRKKGGRKMRSFNIAEKAILVNYALLTSQIVLVLQDAIENKRLTEQQCNLLKEGAQLIQRIIEGAVLVEGKESKIGLTPTMEGLSIYGYALSTFDRLSSPNGVNKFTEFFEKMYSEMDNLREKREKGEKGDIKYIPQLKDFFIALGSSLRVDIQRESYIRKETIFPTIKKQIDASYT